MRRAVFLSLLIAVNSLLASSAGATHRLEQYFEDGCRQWGAPKTLAMAIAETESNMSPWAVNVRGKSFYPETKEEAMRLVRKAIRERKSYDIGLMQINYYWRKRLRLDA